MFYLSRAEQAVLLLLMVLLLAGAGMLTYARGQHAAAAASEQPLFVPAPARPAAPVVAPGAVRQAGSPAETSAVGRARPVPQHGHRASPKAGLISLNTASQKELETLPGIGPVYAGRIIAYREQRKRQGRRGFEAKDELLNVPGIGPKRYAAIRDLVTL
jgi:competence protein ComEA